LPLGPVRTMDTEFDGFMKTLDSLNNDKQIDPSSSFDVDIDDLLASDSSPNFKLSKLRDKTNATKSAKTDSMNTTLEIKAAVDGMRSLDSNATGELATMHNTFMQSIKELADLKISEDADDGHPLQHQPELSGPSTGITTPKSTTLPHRSSIDSRVDEELKLLLETGSCNQLEPEHNDTVELSIDDSNDSEHSEQSDSEIIMHDIDELESITSPPLKPRSKEIDSETTRSANTKPVPDPPEPSAAAVPDIIGLSDRDQGIESRSKPSSNSDDTISLSHLDSDSDSNAPEYDLASFGIKEAAVPPQPTPKQKRNGAVSLRASLPSTSSFENATKSHRQHLHEATPRSESKLGSKASSKASSISSTPHSTKSSGSTPHSTNLKKLKQKLKSAKSAKNGKGRMSKKSSSRNTPQSASKQHVAASTSTVPSTPRPFKTPRTSKASSIQTPRHSLKHSRCSSRATSMASSMANSPEKRKRPIPMIPPTVTVNDQQNEEIMALKGTLKQKEEAIQRLTERTEQQNADIERLTTQCEAAQRRRDDAERDAVAKVKDAESKVFALQCQLKEVEKGKSARDLVVHGDASRLNALSAEEAEKMAMEIKEMDRIIEGLNQENAKLLRQIKEQQIDLRQSQHVMFKENQEITNDLKHTQHRLTELQETKIEELQPAAFDEIQRLRKQLQDAKKTAVGRERELGLEISRLKEENRELQFKVTGLDKRSFDAESDLIEKFKSEALRIQKKSQHQIGELQRKLKWYIENQEVIENLHQQITRQNSEIIALKSRSVSMSSSPPNEIVQRKATKKEHREIVVLKKRVRDLEKMLSSKHPDSIANLLSMIKGGKSEENAEESLIVQQLRDQIATLQDNLENKEDETLARLRGLRQQNDRVQLQLRSKVSSLEAQIAKSKRDKGFVRPNVRIRGLEQQIADLKAAHSKKIKALKDKHLAQIRREQQSKFGGNQNGNGNESEKSNVKDAASNANVDRKVMEELRGELECKSKEVEALSATVDRKVSMIQNLEMIVETKEQSHRDLKTQISLLRTQLKDAITKSQAITQSESAVRVERAERREDRHRVADPAPSRAIPMVKAQGPNGDQRVEEQRKLYEEKIKVLQSEVAELKRQCEILTEKVDLERSKGEQAVKGMQNELEWSKLEKEKADQLVTKLQFEVNHAKSTPSYVEYETLMRQLEQIEQRGKDRERELEHSYLKLLQTNDDVEERLNRKYEGIVATKNEQIRSLQNELSVLMTAFEKIQHT